MPASETSEQSAACSAEAYQSLIGANIGAVTLPTSLKHRILREGQMRTMDFVPDRLNIEIGNDSIVKRVFCG